MSDEGLRVAGVDWAGARKPAGCWIAVVIEGRRFVQASHAPDLATLVAQLQPVQAVGVDIPLGLEENGFRRADALAKGYLGAGAAAVFMTPPRRVVECGLDHVAANRLCQELTGKGISRQAHGLFRLIQEARRVDVEYGLSEVHPEVSFKRLNGNVGLGTKKSWNGFWRRIRILQRLGVDLPDQLPATGGVAGCDDVLDAAVVALATLAVSQGRADSFPSDDDLPGTNGRIWLPTEGWPSGYLEGRDCDACEGTGRIGGQPCDICS